MLDGGEGTHTISFEESTVANGTTLSLTTGGETNFEKLKRLFCSQQALNVNFRKFFNFLDNPYEGTQRYIFLLFCHLGTRSPQKFNLL